MAIDKYLVVIVNFCRLEAFSLKGAFLRLSYIPRDYVIAIFQGKNIATACFSEVLIGIGHLVPEVLVENAMTVRLSGNRETSEHGESHLPSPHP
jgi:hypothetical protein